MKQKWNENPDVNTNLCRLFRKRGHTAFQKRGFDESAWFASPLNRPLQRSVPQHS